MAAGNPAPVLWPTAEANTYGIQLYTDQYCKNPNPVDEALIRGINIPSDCTNTYVPNLYDPNKEIQPAMASMGTRLAARSFGFVNDPNNPNKFQLCVYMLNGCSGESSGLMGSKLVTWVSIKDDVACGKLPGLLLSSFKVIHADDDCRVDNQVNIEPPIVVNAGIGEGAGKDPASDGIGRGIF